MSSTRRISSDLILSAADLLAEAFFDNPAHVYFCPDPKRRSAQLKWLLGANLRLQLDLGLHSFCLVQDTMIDAMGFWTTSNTPKVDRWARIRVGIPLMPFRLGLQGTRRAIAASAEIEQHRDEAIGDQPYWFLNNMVVRAKLRGKGIGSRILTEQLRYVTEREPGFAIGLATQKIENVRFYQRLGFETISEEFIGVGAAAFHNWIMLHPPGIT
jgi:GNAT superfamily N-acetyltransferase